MKRVSGRDKINPKQVRKSYLDKIENELENKGVVFFDEKRLNIDGDFLTLPDNISEVPSKLLGEYLNAFTQQKMYLRTLLGRTELVMEDKRRKYLEVCDSYYREYSNGKLSETSKERLINGLEDVKPYYEEYSDYKNKVNIINYSIANIEDAIFLLSREVSRRTGDFDNERRTYNMR